MQVGTTSSSRMQEPPASQIDPTVPPDEPSPTEAFKNASRLLGEIGEYASYYLSAKADSFKLSLTRTVIMAGVGVLGLLTAGAMAVTAVAILVIGLAQAVAALLGGRAWAGNLIVGILLLALIVGGTIVGLRMITKASRARTIKKYESRQAKQRSDYGSDVADRAAAEGQVSR